MPLDPATALYGMPAKVQGGEGREGMLMWIEDNDVYTHRENARHTTQ
jgi:hypothetical protein